MNLKLLSSIAILSIPAFLSAQKATNEDREYFKDFADAKPTLTFNNPESKEVFQYILKDIETFEGKPRYVLSLVGDEKQEWLVTEDTPKASFTYIAGEDYTKKVKDLLIAEERDLAIQELRRDTYALIPLIETPETFFAVQDPIIEYLDLLNATGRTNEFYSIFKKLNLTKLRDEYTDMSVSLAKILAEKGEFDRCLDVLNVLNIENNRKEYIPELMEILTTFRDANRIDDISRYYDRLKEMKDNKLALEAEMWAWYCYIRKDQVLTAAVHLKNFDNIDKKLPEYSLYKMIAGLVAKSNGEDVPALEAFSEGVVYGKSVDDWMPELMYNTALGYKQSGKIEVAMQILEEMRKFYPENVFLVQAEKDIK